MYVSASQQRLVSSLIWAGSGVAIVVARRFFILNGASTFWLVIGPAMIAFGSVQFFRELLRRRSSKVFLSRSRR